MTDEEEIDELPAPVKPIGVTSEKICVEVSRIQKDDVTIDELGIALNMIDAMKAFVRNAELVWKARAVQYINTNGEFGLGDVKYFVAPSKKEQPRKLEETLDAIFVKAGGDFLVVAGCISKNGFKPGAVKKLFADEPGKFDELFETKTTDKLGIEKPKQLQEFNAAFNK